MKFVAISDTHNQHSKLELPEADVIIHAGDCTGTGTTKQIKEFCEWYGSLDYKYKILVAGNHDWGFEENPRKHRAICEENNIIYLQDSGCEIMGVNIWGSPQTPEFCDWAFNCWRTEEEWLVDRQDDILGKGYDFIGKYWDKVPANTDILVTHGPAYGILDKCPNSVGCELLLEKIKEISPSYHIFGHIHEGSGSIEKDGTVFVNASALDGRYQVIGKEFKVWEI